MIGNKSSIYNAQSVYNQGGGGSSFDVVVNDITTKMIFPPYLVPVEYIDTSALNTSQYNVFFTPKKFTTKNTYKIVTVFSFLENVIDENNNLNYIFFAHAPLGYGTDNSINIYFALVSFGRYAYRYGGKNFLIDQPGLFVTTDKLRAILDCSTGLFTLTDESGHVKTKSETPNYSFGPMGQFSVFGNSATNPPGQFRGKFRYMYILDGDNVVALYVPAREKETNSLFIVDCVSGNVGGNLATNDDSLLTYGPDIDLSQIQDYFT